MFVPSTPVTLIDWLALSILLSRCASASIDVHLAEHHNIFKTVYFHKDCVANIVSLSKVEYNHSSLPSITD